LGYTDKEMKKFRGDPKNEDVLSKSPALMNKTIVVEVIESHGCNSQHKKGDKFYLDGAGNLISKLCPKRMCIFPMTSLASLVFGIHELFMQVLIPMKCDLRKPVAMMLEFIVVVGGTLSWR